MRTLTIALGLLLLTSACTSDPAPAAPWTPVKHPPAPRAQDRDEQAVLGTLVNIDPCRLAGDPGGARLRYPHLCIIDVPGGGSVHIAIDDRTVHADRYALPSKEVGGAKVDAIDTESSDICSAEVPVSFDYAISVHAQTAPGQPKCGELDNWVSKVVAGLGKPALHPKDRPDLSKDACTVLAAAGMKTSHGSRSSIDDCRGDVAGLGGASFGMLIEPGPPEGGWGKKWATVAGKDIYIADDGCQWTWSQGQYAGADNRLMTIDFSGCERAKMPPAKVKAMLTTVIKGLEKPPVPGTVDRLTYRSGEPTEPNPGACADYPYDSCEPYQPTPVPAGDQVNRAANTDPHVACAASADAVNAQFPGMRPVVSPDGDAVCSYVEPSHSLLLDFRVEQGGSDGIAEPTTTRKTTIAGHPGTYAEDHQEKRPPRAVACVDTGKPVLETSLGDNYFWCVTATFQGVKPDLSGAKKLEPLLAAAAVKGFA